MREVFLSFIDNLNMFLVEKLKKDFSNTINNIAFKKGYYVTERW